MDEEKRGGRDASSQAHWHVEVDAEKCSLCEVCTHHCGTGAIRSEMRGDTLFIFFQPGLCDGRGDCMERCPEDAIKVVKVEAVRDQEEQVLVQSKMLRCSQCGAYFAPVSKVEAASHRRGDGAGLIREECPLCRRTQMVATFIEEKRDARGRKAEYRTGKKWHWKPVVDGDPEGPPCPEVLGTPSDQGVSGSGDDSAGPS